MWVAPDGSVEEALVLEFAGAVTIARFEAVVPTSDGGWAFAGHAYYEDPLGVPLPAISGRNALVAKVDAARDLVFARVVGGPGDEEVFDLVEAEDGSLAAIGGRSGKRLAPPPGCRGCPAALVALRRREHLVHVHGVQHRGGVTP